jgi:selenocysteine lyase/cysteine desulfurase
VDAFQAHHERGQELIERNWSGLARNHGVRQIRVPPRSHRTPTVAFVVEGVPSDDVARALAREAVFASNGDFYATTVVRRLGYEREGVTRAGCACYTSADEVERLIDGVRHLAPAVRS